jgi:hypothetical protein
MGLVSSVISVGLFTQDELNALRRWNGRFKSICKSSKNINKSVRPVALLPEKKDEPKNLLLKIHNVQLSAGEASSAMPG